MSFQSFKQQLLADKRKLGVVTTLLLVGLLLWGRLLLKNVPRTAVAEPDKLAQQQPADGGAAVSAVAGALRPEVLIADYGPVERDLFVFDPVYYASASGSSVDPGSSGKSGLDPTDEQKQQMARELAVLAAAGSLTLQATLLDEPNRALINGELIEEGQVIQGFELRNVEERKVTLVRDGVEVVLEMKGASAP